ncbi:hypothetical protein [Egibacter rhizosphaerae]|uniref:hypothetical protein n=1 Tax=Egibacter rhizosphaerae TaxID=1670831 RepID=UPI0013F17659|nr:hypothetical protein [Egibacter rhizosphaerae]
MVPLAQVAGQSAASLLIEAQYGENRVASGTAFVVGNSAGDCFLITNRHNVRGRDNETDETLDKETGAWPDSLCVFYMVNDNPIDWNAILEPLYLDPDMQ